MTKKTRTLFILGILGVIIVGVSVSYFFTTIIYSVLNEPSQNTIIPTANASSGTRYYLGEEIYKTDYLFGNTNTFFYNGMIYIGGINTVVIGQDLAHQDTMNTLFINQNAHSFRLLDQEFKIISIEYSSITLEKVP